jgi:sulfhydrogenase subunit beta (sulfur reductase)
MKVIKLNKKNFQKLVEVCSKNWEVWGPVKEGNKHVFKKIVDSIEFDFSYTRTIIPPKMFFVPPRFNMFRFDRRGYHEELSVTPRIIFGVHPCDIHGILILDKLFSLNYRDPYYMERRENTLIIGHSCIPDDKCFCLSTKTHIVEEGFDLFLTDLGDYYLVWIGSSKGDDLVKVRADIFDEKISMEDIEKYIKWRDWHSKQFSLFIDFTALPDIMELKYNDPIWDKIAESCLSCGSCSMVCPTCNCYNVHDYPDFAKGEGVRVRFWDSCMFKEYSLVAGGHNFRGKRADRLKLWYTHKLQAYIGQYGKPSCVGCGRCIETCPVEINVKTVANSLRGEEVECFWKRI